MLRLAALALFAITLVTIPGTRAIAAITFPSLDLSCFAWCIAHPSQINGDIQLFALRPPGGEATAAAVGTCDDRVAAGCVDPGGDDGAGDMSRADHYSDTAISTGRYVEPKAFDLNLQFKEMDISRVTRRCTNIGSEVRNLGRSDDDCSNVEAGSDYTETISVLTIALIAVLTLAVIPFAWVMHRSYRTWRLRKFGTAVR